MEVKKMTLEQIKAYLNEDYWENGKALGKSGYQKQEIDMDWNRRFVEALSQVIDVKGKCILDLGCGLSGVVSALIEQGADAYGIDLSEYAIEKGKRQAGNLKGKTYVGSVHDLSMFDYDIFDFIHSNQVFEHVPVDLVPEMMKEIYRVMKSGAFAWVGLVIDEHKRTRDEGDPDETHITLMPRAWWESQIKDAGMIVDYSFDEKFRKTRLPDGYSFFEEYGWHAFSFRKP